MGEAREKPALDPEQARSLPARVALSLITSPPYGAEEEASGGGEGALETDGDLERARTDPASAGA
jgi:hypothetical protein